MRFAFWVGMAVLAGARAHASYELLYVLDGAGTTKGIHRFDPISGAYLGKFGQTLLTNPRSIAVGPNGLVYVLDVVYPVQQYGSRVRIFNGSTGQLESSFSINEYFSEGSKISVSAAGNFSVTTGNSYFFNYAIHYAPGGIPAGYTYIATQGVQGAASYIGNSLVLSTEYNGITSVGINPAPGGFTAISSSFTFGGAGNSEHMSTNGSTGILAIGNTFSRFIVNGNNLAQQTIGAIPNVTAVRGIGLGHGNIAKAVGFSSIDPLDFRISTFDATTGDNLGYRSYGALVTNPLDAAIVVAPEPGTLAIMACGLAGIVRLRRNQKS